MSKTIEDARRRTRAVGRKLRGVEVLDTVAAEQLLELEGLDALDGDGEPEV